MTPTASTFATRTALKLSTAGLAAAAAVALAFPSTAAAAPAAPAAPPAAVPNTVPVPAIPYDAELAAALRMIKQAGVDKMAIEAAKAVLGTVGQLSASQAATTPVATSESPLELLKTLGVTPLSPSVAPMCAAPTADNPFGLVTAAAGAVKGPWPVKAAPLATPAGLPTIKLDPEVVKDGQTAYAFIPAAAGTNAKMQVAWFNTTTLQGGFAELKSLADQSPLLKLLPASNLRLAPVDTGKGTILSAVYGTARNGDRTCYFLPAVGVVS